MFDPCIHAAAPTPSSYLTQILLYYEHTGWRFRPVSQVDSHTPCLSEIELLFSYQPRLEMAKMCNWRWYVAPEGGALWIYCKTFIITKSAPQAIKTLKQLQFKKINRIDLVYLKKAGKKIELVNGSRVKIIMTNDSFQGRELSILLWSFWVL